jgi:hypothetical protein
VHAHAADVLLAWCSFKAIDTRPIKKVGEGCCCLVSAFLTSRWLAGDGGEGAQEETRGPPDGAAQVADGPHRRRR